MREKVFERQTQDMLALSYIFGIGSKSIFLNLDSARGTFGCKSPTLTRTQKQLHFLFLPIFVPSSNSRTNSRTGVASNIFLSIKQTNDFELDGWVKEPRDEIAVHEIRDKSIARIII